MSSSLGNDYYKTTLRATWVASPAEATIQVQALPTNLPTILTASKGQPNETKFKVTGVSGDSPSNYALTGVSVISGGLSNLSDGTDIGCYVHEDFFNQYALVVNDDTLRLTDRTTNPDTPSTGKALFFMKNGYPWVIDDAGVATQIGFSSNEWIDVPDAADMNFDLSEPVKKLKFLTAPLTANRTFWFQNIEPGMVWMVRVRQDGVGNRQPFWHPHFNENITLTIASPCVVTTTKDIRTGTPIRFWTNGALPTGLINWTTYYWIRTSATSGNLATSKTNALAGTAINTSGSQSGTHNMYIQIIWSGDEIPTCSSNKWDYDDFFFTAINSYTVTGVKGPGEY